MVKKGLIAGTIALIIVLGTSYFTGNWSYIYYVSGTLGVAFVALALGYLFVSLSLGNQGCVSLAVPNLLAALVYIIN